MSLKRIEGPALLRQGKEDWPGDLGSNAANQEHEVNDTTDIRMSVVSFTSNVCSVMISGPLFFTLC